MCCATLIEDPAAEIHVPNTVTFSENKTTLTFGSSKACSHLKNGMVVTLDYYVQRTEKTKEITIDMEHFGGYYYIEGSTLFRDEETGTDLPAEFIIPRGKVQSNFTFSMASTGDPSTFTFTVDAMPDYLKFDKTKKVLAVIQVIDTVGGGAEEKHREVCPDAGSPAAASVTDPLKSKG